MTEAERSAEFDRLRSEHTALERAHEALHGRRPVDLQEHAAHRDRLRAHSLRLQALVNEFRSTARHAS